MPLLDSLKDEATLAAELGVSRTLLRDHAKVLNPTKQTKQPTDPWFVCVRKGHTRLYDPEVVERAIVRRLQMDPEGQGQ